ncbi:MAG: T9SS type A sorting domain-containing protein [Bacteroidales bacterium]|nr:T9SS type A sorting domain-containing protein [Bacteroidales bacterium]
MNEEGELVSTIRCSDEENIYDDATVVSWDGKLYLATEVIHTDGSYAYNFYRIDRQTQKIEQVASVPFSVRPTVMERGQEIIVELDENTNAREIDVVNALGQTVKRVPVAAGQREVRINSAELGSGMNFINTRTPEGQGTVKIIVK